MLTRYEIGLPGLSQRLAILRGYIARHHSEMGHQGVADELMMDRPDGGSGGVGAVSWVAQRTEGYSGSDLVELCSNAAQRVLSEYWAQQRWEAGDSEEYSRTPAGMRVEWSTRHQKIYLQSCSLSPSSFPNVQSCLRLAAVARGEGPASLTAASSSAEVRVRSVTRADFEAALEVTRPGTAQADEYHARKASQGSNGAGGSANDLMAMILKMAAAASNNGGKSQ